NGKPVRIDNPAAQMTLLDFVRARGLTGAKEGCAEGECGACAVALVERDSSDRDRSTFRVVNSCLMFLPMAAGREMYTVEALAVDGELSDAQRAMAVGGGSQCGYCTPGFVVSLFAEHYRGDRTGPCDTTALTGNMCRCTCYRPIRDAVLSLGPPPDDDFRARLERPAVELEPFSIPGFARPSTVDECIAILREHSGAKVVAGGTDLGVESNLFGRRWPHLVSVDAIDELRELSSTPQRVLIGAALPLSEIARRWPDAPDVFREWLALFASPLIRNRATLGGNLATASPIGDASPLLLALDAIVHIAAASGRRSVPLSSFFTGYRKTALEVGELITAVEIPKPLPQSVRFYKVAKRKLDDISTVAAAIALDIEASGKVRRARIALGGVAATPIRVGEAEDALTDQPWNDAAVERVQAAFDRVLRPMSDHRGSKEYRLAVSKALVEKFQWEEAS
ncbi:MAG TPA: FAD binding domain-containing protein, partial [Vicinamibacterales bacterium]|nr:FAD binding domain-containing protein [Vicinamibacterales bacterium]